MSSKCIRLLSCFLLNGFLFGIVLLFFKPLFNSGDDTVCLYILGGGFGSPPSELLYYNHLLHPVITLPIKFFFIQNPDINWYGGCLLLFHFLATSLIFIYITFGKPFYESIIIYSCLFFVFECTFLMSLSFTNTSIILTWAGISVLFFIKNNSSVSFWNNALAVLCLSLAAFFRIHIIIPFVALALPFFFLPIKIKKAAQLILLLGIAGLLIVVSKQVHEFYYARHIPNWAEGEAYRQKLYKFYNEEGIADLNIAKWETEKQLVKNTLIVDTNYISSDKLVEMHEAFKIKKSAMPFKLNREQLYWLFMNNRICFFALVFTFFFYATNRLLRVTAASSFLLLVAGIVLLIMYFKLPNYIVVGGTGLIFLLIALSYNHSSIRFLRTRNFRLLKYSLFSFFLIWGTIRIYKTDIINRQMNFFFKNAFKEIESHRNEIFLVIDGSFPLDYFSIFDSPKNYSLENVSLGWQYAQELNLKVIKDFKINKPEDIPLSKNLLVWGKPVQALLDYFEITTGKKYCFSAPLKDFTYGEVRRLVACE